MTITMNEEQRSSMEQPQPPQQVSRRSLSERISDKIIAAIYVGVAVIVCHWTHFFQVLLNPKSSGANVTLLQLSAVAIGINIVLLLYLVVYLPYVLKLKDSSAWEVYCPSVIPIMTFTGVINIIFLIRGTWPVWGFFSPLILIIEVLGLFFSLQLIPALPFC